MLSCFTLSRSSFAFIHSNCSCRKRVASAAAFSQRFSSSAVARSRCKRYSLSSCCKCSPLPFAALRGGHIPRQQPVRGTRFPPAPSAARVPALVLFLVYLHFELTLSFIFRVTIKKRFNLRLVVDCRGLFCPRSN